MEYVINLYEKYKSIVRFGFVGVINTGVDFLVFSLLYSFFGLDKLLCQIAGYGMGIVNSFIMNKLWTFENKKTRFNTINQLVLFVIVNLVSLGISLIGLQVLDINVYAAKIIVTIFAQVVNYCGYRFWVFK